MNYYLVGTGNFSDSSIWSATSGGSGGAGVPTPSDNVFLDANSGAVTLTIDLAPNECADFDNTGFTGTLTFLTNKNLDVYGDLILSLSATYTSSPGSIRMSGSGVITSNEASLGTHLQIFGTYQLSDDVITGPSWGYLILRSGSFTSNNHSITCKRLLGEGTEIVSASFGSSSINCDFFSFTNPNGTFDFGTSTIISNAPGTANNLGGQEYYDVEMTFGTGSNRINGSGSFNELTLNGNSNSYLGIALSGDIEAEDLVIDPTSVSSRLLFYSSVAGTQRTITVNNSLTVENCDFIDIFGAGSVSWDLSALEVGDGGGNSGITFPTPKDRFWGATSGGNFSATSSWSETDGGATGASIPLLHDTAKFTSNSITSGSRTITFDIPRICALDFTGILNTPATSFSQNSYLFGITYKFEGLTFGGTARTLNLYQRSSLDFNNNNISIPHTLKFNDSVSLSDIKLRGGNYAINIVAGKTITLTGTNPIDAVGASGNLITIQSATLYSKATLNCTNASGVSLCDYLVLRDIYITGDALIYPGKNTTQIARCTGFKVNSVMEYMTSNSLPSPFTVSATNENGTNYIYKAFNSDLTDNFISTALSEITIDFGANKWISQYRVSPRFTSSSVAGTPTEWTISAKPDGGNYAQIDSQTGISWTLGDDTKRYALSTPVYCRYIKMNITAVNGGGSAVYLSLLEFINSLENEKYYIDDNIYSACPYNDSGNIYNDLMEYGSSNIKSFWNNIENNLAVTGIIPATAGTTTASRSGQKSANNNLSADIASIFVMKKALSTAEKARLETYQNSVKGVATGQLVAP